MNMPGRGWWQRLRHSRGFGVHSPFAYRFIREVLRERCAFYAYDDVDAVAGSWPGGRAGARLLMRTAAWMRPDAIAVCGHGPEAAAARSIATLACPCARLSELPQSGHVMTVLCPDADETMADAIYRALAGSDSGLLFVAERRRGPAAALLARIHSNLHFGHLFVNGSGTAIYVGRDTLPAETFRVRF